MQFTNYINFIYSMNFHTLQIANKHSISNFTMNCVDPEEMGLIGFALMPFNSGEMQTHWFVCFASFGVFATRALIKPNMKMPERIGFLGFRGMRRSSEG